MSELFAGAAFESAVATASAAPSTDTSAAPAPTTAASGVSPDAGTATTAQAAEVGPTQAVSTETKPGDQAGKDKKGPIPFDVHDTALKNARTKAADETKAAYAWAERVPEKHRQTIGQFYGLLDRDPVQAIDLLIQQASADEQHAPRLRSYFGRMLGTGRRSAEETPDLSADYVVTTQDGKEVPMASLDRINAIVAHALKQAKSEWDQKLTPYERDRQAREATARQADAKRQADAEADALYARVSKWVGFTDHEAAIAAAMQADEALDVFEAYQKVVVPHLNHQAKVQIAADMRDKSAASSQNPNAATAAAKKPQTFEEAFAALPASAWAG